MWGFGFNPWFLNFSWTFFIPFRVQGPVLFLSGVVKYYWHHSGRPSRCYYFLCLIALEIVHLGQIFFQLGKRSGRVLHLCSPLPWWINVSRLKMLLPRGVDFAGPGALWPWAMILGDNLKWVSLWVLAMLQSIHRWLPGAGWILLGSRVSDGKNC